MLECHCGAFVSSDRRTCPNGHTVNPEAKDPTVQNEPRPGAALANLRLKNLQLQNSVEEHQQAAQRSADRSALLEQALIEISNECDDLRRTLELTRHQVRGLDDRLRQLRNRLENLGISTQVPIVATQAQMRLGENVLPTDSNSVKESG
ncbi:hypothetical protein BH23CHL4_BH23CHL4_20150 [soil metagenome]